MKNILKQITNKFFGRKNMANATTKNYTDEMTVKMVETYKADPTRATVDAIALS